MKEWVVDSPLFSVEGGRNDPMAEKKVPVPQRVWELAEPLAADLGLTLWDVVYQKEGADWILRVTVDKEGGVSIDDCVDLTHALDPVLDEADPIAQEYLLEVSSPGFERKLTRRQHFEKYLGRPLRVKLHKALEDGTKVLEGELVRVEENGDFTLSLYEDTTATFEMKECTSVNLVEEL